MSDIKKEFYNNMTIQERKEKHAYVKIDEAKK